MSLKWYAVYTRPQCEKKVVEALTRKNFVHYCPFNKVVKQYGGRPRPVSEPLFASYVFVRAAEWELAEVRKADGVVNLVYWLDQPAVIRDEEIANMKMFLDEYETVRLQKAQVNIEDSVRVTSGPLMAQETTAVAVSKQLVRLLLPSLGYSIVAEAASTNLEVLVMNGKTLHHSSYYKHAVN